MTLLFPKPTKTPKVNRKRLPAKSKKRAAFHASDIGQSELAYMGAVKTLPCVVCGARPSDAHHCKDKPAYNERGLYVTLPIGRKSSGWDTIPLCKECHTDSDKAYHRDRAGWVERNGPDYGHIAPTRAAVAAMGQGADF